MLPNIILSPESRTTKKKTNRVNMEAQRNMQQHHLRLSSSFYGDHVVKQPPVIRKNTGIKKMAINKVSNLSDLIQRVTSSCFLHPLPTRHHHDTDSEYDEDIPKRSHSFDNNHQHEDEEADDDDEEQLDIWQQQQQQQQQFHENPNNNKNNVELEMLVFEVFEAVAAMKRAYVGLQAAHCPWDADKMRMSDVAVVAELRRLALLRERFRRTATITSGNGNNVERRVVGSTLREVVAPYEAAMEELKREVKVRDAEVENLKEKLKMMVVQLGNNNGGGGGGKKGRGQSKRRVSCSSQAPPVSLSPAPEIFEATMSMVKEASKSFTALLLSLMKSAHWDIAAAVRSIEAAAGTATVASMDSIVGPNHAKYAMESYVNRKGFQGFDHETFYMDGSLSSLLHPDQFRRDCFTQYRDMKAMDPIELLGILPTCDFGKFCSKKYLSIIHPKMEESLFGDLEQRCQVLAGNHPRSRFYGEYLALAKAIWLLHLLAFSMEPPPSYFEGTSGAEFHSQYMESVVKFPGGTTVVGQVVGFPVSPGFKLANGSVIKARVYLVPKNGF